MPGTTRRGSEQPSPEAAAVLDALGDPTRRDLLATIAATGQVGATATELARDRTVSRQAVAKHLQVLVAAGLVQAERTGREHRHRLRPDGLVDATAWLAAMGAEWDRRLARLAARHG